ncbi:hypothetical protein F443_13325, partial [Phytophthora nicotianae P1569]
SVQYESVSISSALPLGSYCSRVKSPDDSKKLSYS